MSEWEPDYAAVYANRGRLLTGIRADPATENFNMSAEQIMKDETFIDRHNAESGVFCLVPDELDIPF